VTRIMSIEGAVLFELHKLCETFSASVCINYRLPIKVYYRICTLRHIRIEINHGSQNVFWVLTMLKLPTHSGFHDLFLNYISFLIMFYIFLIVFHILCTILDRVHTGAWNPWKYLKTKVAKSRTRKYLNSNKGAWKPLKTTLYKLS
jgi:hypothetical protein